MRHILRCVRSATACRLGVALAAFLVAQAGLVPAPAAGQDTDRLEATADSRRVPAEQAPAEQAPTEQAYAMQVPAQGTDPVVDGGQALQGAKREHLWRVAAWGGLNVAGGLALVLASSRSTRSARWHFGAMSAGWGAVNVGIAAAGLATLGSPPADAAALLASERQFHDILLVNLGLNVAYAGVGATMWAAGTRGVERAGRWRGFGTSLVLQGVGLLVLDGVAFFASRARLADLVGVAGDLSARALPSGAALTLTF
jgi:hypothetical protein